MIKHILNNLRKDIFGDDTELLKLLLISEDCQKDIEEYYREIYARDFAPVRVSKTSLLSQSCISDEDMFLNFSEGFSLFLEKINRDITRLLRKRSEALNTLYCITKLNSTYSELLIMRYYENKTIEEIMAELYISQSTYYRTLKKAIFELEKILNSQSNIIE